MKKLDKTTSPWGVFSDNVLPPEQLTFTNKVRRPVVPRVVRGDDIKRVLDEGKKRRPRGLLF